MNVRTRRAAAHPARRLPRWGVSVIAAGAALLVVMGPRFTAHGRAAAPLEKAAERLAGPSPAAKPAPPALDALNVTEFGADPAPDGDDTAALQRAFDASRDKGRDVYLPPGTYRVESSLQFRADGQTICGAGERTIIAGDTTRIPLLELKQTLRATLRDFRIEGPHINQQNVNDKPAIDCVSGAETLVKRVHAYGTGYLVRDTGGVKTTLEDCIIEDYGRIGYLVGTGGTVRRCRFVCRDDWRFEGQMNGIYASAGKSDVTVEDSEFIHCGMYAMTLWGSQQGTITENIVIRRNRFDRCLKGFVVAAGPDGPRYRKVLFEDNLMRGSSEKSIHVGKFNGSTADGTALVIRNNVFEDPGSDMSIFVTNWANRAPITGVRITGNRFLSPGKSAYNGLYVWQSDPAAELSDVLIDDNTFKDFGHNQGEEKAHCAIYLKAGNGVTVRGNTFQHWSGAGASRDVDAIRVDPAMRKAVIENNTFVGSGRKSSFAVRVTGPGAGNSVIRNNTLRKSLVAPADIPSTANKSDP